MAITQGRGVFVGYIPHFDPASPERAIQAALATPAAAVAPR